MIIFLMVRLPLFLCSSILACGCAAALPVTVDPSNAFTGSWAEEWNAGITNGWAADQTSGTVTGGAFTGTTTGTNSGVQLQNFANGPDLDLGFNDFMELRIKVPADYTGAIQIFYGTTAYTVNTASGETTTAATTGFNANRVITIPAASIPKDGAFHIYRIELGLEPAWRAKLRDLRIDPVDGAGSSGMAFAIDYIRIGDEPGATVYQPRITTECPAAGGTHPYVGNTESLKGTTQTVMAMESKHFRFLWDSTAATDYPTFWNADMAKGTLRNLEEAWQVFTKKLGYREPSHAVGSLTGTSYKLNVTSWYGGYWAGGDSFGGTDFARLNITPDGLRVDPPTWVIPHELMHCFQLHNTTTYVPGEWWEFHANYGRERWLQHYQNLYPNASGIDPTFVRSAHLGIGAGRDYYLCWPFFLYLDENPDGLPDLGEGTTVKLWQNTQQNEYSLMTLERLTVTSSLKDIVGGYARRGLNFNYSSKAAIQATLATFTTPLDAAATARWQFTDLIQRSDDPSWWRVPYEMAPMEGAYAIHELVVPNPGTAGRVVTVDLDGLPDAGRGADWSASFIAVADNGTERYGTLWSSGTNSITLGSAENKLYLSVAGAPSVFYYGGADEVLYPYRSHPAKVRFPYEIQVTGASPKQRGNGATTGLTKHSNGGGYKSASATVASTAYIGPNARVIGNANVSGNARIEDDALVQDTAQISGNAVVSGHAWVRGNAIITDYAKVRDWALVEGGAISGSARVMEHGNVKGGLVTDIATVKGSAASLEGTLSGNAIIDGDYGDFFYGRNVANGVAFGHLPYAGVPDGAIRALPTGLYASYDFATAHDSRILDQYGVTDGFTSGSPVWVAADAKRKGFLTFDGNSQFVSLDRSVADLRDFTFSAWVRPSGGISNQALLWLGASTTQRLCFTPDNGSGQSRFSIVNGGSDLSITASALTPGVWTHVAVTLDGTTGKIYLNGALAGSTAITLHPDQLLAPNTATGLQQNYLGRSQGITMPMFRGALDDVQFYGKALSAAEITAQQPPTTLAGSGTLYVDLRANDASAGSPTWTNNGTIGNFTQIGSPAKLANVAGTGIPGVSFNGTNQAYSGPNSVADIDGASDRSIEVWAYNPALAEEETMVSWGHRGTDSRDMAFNFGNHPDWGAVTHWGDDLGWGINPSANGWHYLVYTYDGATTAKVYIDGVQANSKTLLRALNTFAGEPLNIGCQRDTANGSRSLFYGGYLNSVRIHGGVLTASQIATNFAFGPAGAPGNSAPTISAVPDQILDYGATTASIPITVSDTDTAFAGLSVVASSSNSSLVPASGISISGTTGLRTVSITPTAATGTATITLTVGDGAATASRSFIFTILSQAETWRKQNFSSTTNSGDAADEADPDKDGVSNLLERAFGGNPKAADQNLMPAVDNTAPLLSIVYHKSKAATDLSFTVLESPDLKSNPWTSATGTSTILSETASRQNILFTSPVGSAKTKFLRLQVSGP